MKKLLQTTMYIIICMLILSSCGSKKGKWSSSDMEKCKTEGIADLEKDNEMKEISEMMEVTIEEMVDCSCKKAETMFESYSEADKELDKMSDMEVLEKFADCFGFVDKDGNWSKTAKNLFMKGCNVEPGLEKYCECVLSKIDGEYSFMALGTTNEDELNSIYESCFSEIEY